MSCELTILMPAYNSEKYIASALESIVKQKLCSAEILLIDGASSDATLKVAEQFIDQLNIKIISEKDRGVNDAYRKGLTLASGRYVCTMPSTDGYFDPNYLRSALAEFKKSPRTQAVLAAGAFEIDDDGTPLYQLHPWKLQFYKIFAQANHKILSSSLGILLPDMGFVIEKDLLLKIFPDENEPIFGYSATFVGVLNNLYASDAKFIVLPKIASFGRHHPGQFTNEIYNDNKAALRIFRNNALKRLIFRDQRLGVILLKMYALLIFFLLVIAYGGVGYYSSRLYIRITSRFNKNKKMEIK